MTSAGQSSYGERWDVVLALPGLADAVLSARATVDRLLAHPVLRQRAGAVAAEVSLRCGRASASLESDSGVADEAVLAGSLRAQAELPSLVRVWATSPRQALARLHLLAAVGVAPADELGRPAGDHGARAVARAVASAAAAGPTPAIVVAAGVGAELGTAFGSVSGVVARAAARLVLAERGLDPSLLVAVDVGHLERGGYDAALAAYRTGEPDGVAAWLLHNAGAVDAGAAESLAICEAIVRG